MKKKSPLINRVFEPKNHPTTLNPEYHLNPPPTDDFGAQNVTVIFQGAVFIFEHISMFSDLAPQIYIKPQKKGAKVQFIDLKDISAYDVVLLACCLEMVTNLQISGYEL